MSEERPKHSGRDAALFLREFLRTCRTTGAILPSGRKLADALSRSVRQAGEKPRHILEVGPGTGAVTEGIVAAMRPDDRLDLVELNERFVARLRDRMRHDPKFRAVSPRTRIFHCDIEELPQEAKYDLIVSGLPLNNFSVESVERILHALTGLLKPGGTLSFFEYIAIRRALSLVSGARERMRLRGIGSVLRNFLQGREIRRDRVWLNVPPACVHHLHDRADFI